jgi:ATP-dependent helicase/nuclease subunit A
MARAFDRSGWRTAGLGTLPDFARRLRDSIREETVEALAATHPEAGNVVRLMTIHQAKGLEFPVVIVADMDRPGRAPSREAVYHSTLGPLVPAPDSGPLETDNIAIEMHRYLEKREDANESLRMLYVALTRAADHLILSAGLQANGRLYSPWMKLLAERFDLRTGLPKGDPYLGTGLKGRPGTSELPEIYVHHKAPGQTHVAGPKSKPLPLARFRELVEESEAGTLPPLMRPLPAVRALPPQLPVSAIEQADALLQGTETDGATLALPGEPADPSNRDDPTVLGTVVHSVIDRLGWLLDPKAGRPDGASAAESITAVVKDALRGLSPSDGSRVSPETVTRRVEALVASDLWRELAAAQRWFHEIDFLLPWPKDAPEASRQAIISGQIDCLVQTAQGGWKIIDYKTGRVPQGDPAALFEHFGIQLVLYAEAVRAMTGRLPESIEIVAVHDTIRRFPLTLWDEFVAKMTRRIDAAISHLAAGSPAFEPIAEAV